MRDRRLGTITRLAGMGVLPSDSDEDRLRKAILTLSTALISVAGIIWGTTYAALGLWRAAILPPAYSALSIFNLLYFAVTKRYIVFRFGQLLLILVIPFLVQASLGGFAHSGAVMLWALMAPLGALMFHGTRQALPWLLAFLALAVSFAALESTISTAVQTVPAPLSASFFAMNIAGVSTVIYILMHYFVREREEAQGRSERLLLNVLPKSIADRLKRDPTAIADGYAEVTVLFADIVDFTKFSAGITPLALVDVLNDVFTQFDELAERYGLEKIKATTFGGIPSTPQAAWNPMACQVASRSPSKCTTVFATATSSRRVGSYPLKARVSWLPTCLWGVKARTRSRPRSHRSRLYGLEPVRLGSFSATASRARSGLKTDAPRPAVRVQPRPQPLGNG